MAFLVTALLVVGTRVRRYVRRVGVLRWGRVATVTKTQSGTSGTTNRNVPMRQARVCLALEAGIVALAVQSVLETWVR